MYDISTFAFEVANILLLTSWVVLAFLLWRVRHTKLLGGGECMVITTLLVFAIVRAMQILDYRPWDFPTITGVISGLTIISTLIVGKALHKYYEREKAVDSLQLTLPPNARALFQAIRNGHNGGH